MFSFLCTKTKRRRGVVLQLPFLAPTCPPSSFKKPKPHGENTGASRSGRRPLRMIGREGARERRVRRGLQMVTTENGTRQDPRSSEVPLPRSPLLPSPILPAWIFVRFPSVFLSSPAWISPDSSRAMARPPRPDAAVAPSLRRSVLF
jgi:hypothetical protein